ncbi:MAG: hypothetical protein Q7S21_04970 [archaeon]|nr:hypothetical protein [archaeon]
MPPKRAKVGVRQKGKRKMLLRRVTGRIRQYPDFGTHGFNMRKVEEAGGIKQLNYYHGHYFVSTQSETKKTIPRRWLDSLRAGLDTNLSIAIEGNTYDKQTKTFKIKKYYPIISLVMAKEGIKLIVDPEDRGYGTMLVSRYHGSHQQRRNISAFPVYHDPIAPNVHQIYLTLDQKDVEEIDKKWRKNFESRNFGVMGESFSANIFFHYEAIEIFVKKILAELEKQAPKRKPIKPK